MVPHAATTFCCCRICPMIAEDACDGDFNAGAVMRPVNDHVTSPLWADAYF